MAKLYFVVLFSAVAASLNSFIEKHFSDNTICLVFSAEIDFGLSFTQSKILFNVLDPLNEFNSKFMHHRMNYLVIAKDIKNLMFVIRRLTLNHNHNTKEKHLILIENNLNSKELERCFALLWQQDIYNVVIKTTTNNTAFSTWFPYKKYSNCGDNVVIKINVRAPFSSKIPSRFTSCKVKLIWKFYPVLTTNLKEEPPGVINQMLLLIADKIGLTMHFQQEENELVYEELFNRTPTIRLAEYTTKNRIDIVANMYGPALTLYLDDSLEVSLPFTIHEDYWLLPAKQPLPSIESFLSALNLQQYILISLTLVSFMFIWRLASNNFFDVFRIFLQQPVHGSTSCTKKLLLIFGLFFAIHVDLFYSSQLIRVLYRPVYPLSYKTLKEVLDKTDLKFCYPSYAGRILQNKDVQLWKRVEGRTEEVLTSRIYTVIERKRRFLSLKGVLEIGSYDFYYVYNPQDLEVLEEQLATNPLFILMRRRFALADTINLNIQRLQEGGIINKLLRDAHRYNSKFEVPKKQEITSQKGLKLKDTEMIGFLLIVGYSIAFLVFIGELIVSHVELRMLQLQFIN